MRLARRRGQGHPDCHLPALLGPQLVGVFPQPGHRHPNCPLSSGKAPAEPRPAGICTFAAHVWPQLEEGMAGQGRAAASAEAWLTLLRGFLHPWPSARARREAGGGSVWGTKSPFSPVTGVPVPLLALPPDLDPRIFLEELRLRFLSPSSAPSPPEHTDTHVPKLTTSGLEPRAPQDKGVPSQWEGQATERWSAATISPLLLLCLGT